MSVEGCDQHVAEADLCDLEQDLEKPDSCCGKKKHKQIMSNEATLQLRLLIGDEIRPQNRRPVGLSEKELPGRW